jgi:hypothetical protein
MVTQLLMNLTKLHRRHFSWDDLYYMGLVNDPYDRKQDEEPSELNLPLWWTAHEGSPWANKAYPWLRIEHTGEGLWSKNWDEGATGPEFGGRYSYGGTPDAYELPTCPTYDADDPRGLRSRAHWPAFTFQKFWQDTSRWGDAFDGPPGQPETHFANCTQIPRSELLRGRD